MKQLEAIGWREWVYLPESAGSPPLRTKIDTGARSAALDATRIEIGEPDQEGECEVTFRLQFEAERDVSFIDCKMPAHFTKTVRNSSGQGETRPFVKIPIQIGKHIWTIEASLTNRGEMLHRMLLGRTAIKNRFLVDPTHTFLFGKSATTK